MFLGSEMSVERGVCGVGGAGGAVARAQGMQAGPVVAGRPRRLFGLSVALIAARVGRASSARGVMSAR